MRDGDSVGEGAKAARENAMKKGEEYERTTGSKA